MSEDQILNKTALHSWHKAQGAKMLPFAGYEMPIEYKGILHEHELVRNKVGLFDVSHMGWVQISGASCAEKVNRVFSRDLSKILVGSGAYSVLCFEDGGTVDDLIAYRTGADEFSFILNADNKYSDVAYLKSCSALEGLKIEGPDENFSIFALQGPFAFHVLEKLGCKGGQDAAPYSVISFEKYNERVLVLISGYTGEKGCELLVPRTIAVRLWEDLIEKGAEWGLEPVGLGARDTLRLEMGYSLYGHELSPDINPLEAGLKWACSFEKELFVGSEALKEYSKAPQRKLIALKGQGRRAPRAGMDLYDATGKHCGVVTSGTFAPSLLCGIALALVSYESQAPYQIDFRGKKIDFELSRRPFYRKVEAKIGENKNGGNQGRPSVHSGS